MMDSKEFNALADAIRKDDAWFSRFITICIMYYIDNGAGGSLHIVLDDGNLNRESIIFCQGYAGGKEDDRGGDIANLMLWMTIKQKRRVYSNYNLYSKGGSVYATEKD